MKWNELSMKEKLPFMQKAIVQGIVKPSEIEEHFNSFQDGGDTKSTTWTPNPSISGTPSMFNVFNSTQPRVVMPGSEQPILRSDNRTSKEREEDRKRFEEKVHEEKLRENLYKNQHIWQIDPTRGGVPKEAVLDEYNYQRNNVRNAVDIVGGELIGYGALKAAKPITKAWNEGVQSYKFGKELQKATKFLENNKISGEFVDVMKSPKTQSQSAQKLLVENNPRTISVNKDRIRENISIADVIEYDPTIDLKDSKAVDKIKNLIVNNIEDIAQLAYTTDKPIYAGTKGSTFVFNKDGYWGRVHTSPIDDNTITYVERVKDGVRGFTEPAYEGAIDLQGGHITSGERLLFPEATMKAWESPIFKKTDLNRRGTTMLDPKNPSHKSKIIELYNDMGIDIPPWDSMPSEIPVDLGHSMVKLENVTPNNTYSYSAFRNKENIGKYIELQKLIDKTNYKLGGRLK